MRVKEYGYEYDAMLDQNLWEQTKGCVTNKELWGAICLRSGRDAIKAIAREFDPTKVLIPALSCDSMALPFKMYGHQIEYYRLNEAYSIDFLYLEQRIPTTSKPILFLYMDYFGNRAIDDFQLEELKKKHPNLIFIEDRTHTMIWKRISQFEPNYIMASLRKWLSIPDGGLLWSRDLMTDLNFSEDTSFSENRLKAQCMRNQFFCTGDKDLKLKYRKIFSHVSDIMDCDKSPSRMSAYAYEIANKTDWNVLCEKRKNNAKSLKKILENTSVRLLQTEMGLSDLYVAFTVEDRDHIQKKLALKGIFNTIIWPLNEKQRLVCPIAKYTETHMLAAPCDQRYDVGDMEYIGNEIARVFNE